MWWPRICLVSGNGAACTGRSDQMKRASLKRTSLDHTRWQLRELLLFVLGQRDVRHISLANHLPCQWWQTKSQHRDSRVSVSCRARPLCRNAAGPIQPVLHWSRGTHHWLGEHSNRSLHVHTTPTQISDLTQTSELRCIGTEPLTVSYRQRQLRQTSLTSRQHLRCRLHSQPHPLWWAQVRRSVDRSSQGCQIARQALGSHMQPVSLGFSSPWSHPSLNCRRCNPLPLPCPRSWGCKKFGDRLWTWFLCSCSRAGVCVHGSMCVCVRRHSNAMLCTTSYVFHVRSLFLRHDAILSDNCFCSLKTLWLLDIHICGLKPSFPHVAIHVQSYVIQDVSQHMCSHLGVSLTFILLCGFVVSPCVPSSRKFSQSR